MATLAVVIPAKNEEEYLPTVLAALRMQTRQPDEIVVADAESTDGTPDVARRFGATVVDGGLPGVGRNHGAAASTSDLIFFLDADVVIDDSQFLEKAVDEFERRAFDVATADICVKDGTPFDRWTHRFYNRYARFVAPVQQRAPGFCILVRRALHESIGGFDESVLFCEDHEYVTRAAKRGRFGILNDVTIGVTTRRMERDGRWNILAKYLLAEAHITFLGPIRHDFFKYGFGYEKKRP